MKPPPDRVIVRSLPFILSCFVLSGLAAYDLRQRIRIPLVVAIGQGLLLPAGFILIVQKYYNGATDSHYAPAVILFSLAMGINGIIYLRSLVAGKNLKNGKKQSHISRYDIKLYTLNDDGTPDRLSYHDTGETPLLAAILLDGYSQNQCIDLHPYWDEIHDRQIETLQTDITVHETIIKFGETVTLIDCYRLQISVNDRLNQ